MNREETIPYGRAIWQSDTAKTYQCPHCLRPLFSQFEGDESPTVICNGPLTQHKLIWDVADANDSPAREIR